MTELEIPHLSGQIAILADLHLEHYRAHDVDWFAHHQLNRLPWAELDALIVAGDLVNDPDQNLRWALRQVGKYIDLAKVVMMPGNHDYYLYAVDFDAQIAEMVESEGAHFAQKRVLRHGDDRFLCATLWSDFAVRGSVELDMELSRLLMNDYRMIGVRGRDPSWLPEFPRSKLPTLFSPEIAAMLHEDHKAWLVAELQQEFAGRTIVATHHCPHPSLLAPKTPCSAAYASDLGELISTYHPDAWFFGHTHHRNRARIGATDVRNVSLGYPGDPRTADLPRVTDFCLWT